MLQWLDTLTVCDPACGSGAFLTAVYNWFEQNRLDILTDLHNADPDAPECHDQNGLPGDIRDWTALSAPLILKNNVFGVDLSPESVEIAQLSLWIRTARRGQPLTDLSANILPGNSVVDDPSLDPAHAFPWHQKFPHVFANGGFDAIVGNPPYVRQERLAPFKDHFATHYKAASGTADLYVYFYEKGVDLLKPGGLLAFISSGTFVKGAFAAPLRKLLSTEASLVSLIDFGEFQPFPDAEMVRPSCVVLEKGDQQEMTTVLKFLGKVEIPRDLGSAIAEMGVRITTPRNTDGDWQLENEGAVSLLKKIQAQGAALEEYTKGSMYRGVGTGDNDVFVIDSEMRNSFISQDPDSAEIIHPFLQGTHLRPWFHEESDQWLIFTQRGIDIEKYQSIKQHLLPHRRELEPRPRDWTPSEKVPVWPGRKPGSYTWYEIQDPIEYAPAFSLTKIVFPDIAKLPRCSMDRSKHYLGNSAYCIPLEDYYLLGVLNSWAIWFVIS
ncbi:MAG TPA: DNA methyltransferase, partial [Isosphaeraceae bacterium]|nr:DNA methyltransferase [Isosphaeraceae bacterium]